jgi:hypothetical protein
MQQNIRKTKIVLRQFQDGGHVTSSPMAPFDWPDPKTYSHLNYVCICSRTKVMVENVILGTIINGGHLEIQYGGHVTSSSLAPFDWPDLKT